MSVMSLTDKLYRAHNESLLLMTGHWYEQGAIVSGNERVFNWGKGNVVVSGSGGIGNRMTLTDDLVFGVETFDPKTKDFSNVGALKRGWKSNVGSAISPVLSTYFAYQGYQGNMSGREGLMGLMDALSIDYGTMLGLRTFGPQIKEIADTVADGGGPRTYQSMGIFRTLRVGIGAGVGASMGNAVLGAPGSVIGGLVGGAAMGTPLGMATTLVAGSAATAGYGAYTLLKTGYRHGRNIRMSNVPHTAGDTSAFFTQNAFTMRSQAIQAMRNSHLNARTALGQEATFMHTNKNYFSTYR